LLYLFKKMNRLFLINDTFEQGKPGCLGKLALLLRFCKSPKKLLVFPGLITVLVR